MLAGYRKPARPCRARERVVDLVQHADPLALAAILFSGLRWSGPSRASALAGCCTRSTLSSRAAARAGATASSSLERARSSRPPRGLGRERDPGRLARAAGRGALGEGGEGGDRRRRRWQRGLVPGSAPGGEGARLARVERRLSGAEACATKRRSRARGTRTSRRLR